MSNAIHSWLDGTMSRIEVSANDPIFIGHHVFVDSLFEIWLRKDKRQDEDGKT